MHFDTEWTRDRIEENQFINQVRAKVGLWRRGQLAGRDARRRAACWTLDCGRP